VVTKRKIPAPAGNRNPAVRIIMIIVVITVIIIIMPLNAVATSLRRVDLGLPVRIPLET